MKKMMLLNMKYRMKRRMIFMRMVTRRRRRRRWWWWCVDEAGNEDGDEDGDGDDDEEDDDDVAGDRNDNDDDDDEDDDGDDDEICRNHTSWAVCHICSQTRCEERINVYFNEATGGRYVPRAVLMDLEPGQSMFESWMCKPTKRVALNDQFVSGRTWMIFEQSMNKQTVIFCGFFDYIRFGFITIIAVIWFFVLYGLRKLHFYQSF